MQTFVRARLSYSRARYTHFDLYLTINDRSKYLLAIYSYFSFFESSLVSSSFVTFERIKNPNARVVGERSTVLCSLERGYCAFISRKIRSNVNI